MEILGREISESLFSSIDRNIDIDYNIKNSTLLKTEWENNRLLLRSKLSNIDIDFLNNSGIGGLMFQCDSETFNMELRELPKLYYSNIKEYRQSNINTEIGVSTNTIHHLYHLYKYLDHKNLDMSKFRSKRIIEWGGGYGNMAKIVTELGITNNYLIIDIPEFITIQYIYLVSYFGVDKVYIIKDIKNIKEGCINLISVDNIVKFPDYDTFISNWAITESSLDCQKICIDNDILSKNMIVSYHQCGEHISFMSESKEFHSIMLENNIHTEEIYFGGGRNYYAFS